MSSDRMQVSVTSNGPYRVTGAVPIARQTIVADAEGGSVDWEQGEVFDAPSSYSLCRCGHSSKKPFCDDTHLDVHFDGTETASHLPYLEQAGEQDGPTLTLTDAEPLFAFARFCDVAGQIWNLVEEAGPDAAALTRREAAKCPSSRLVVWDRSTGQALEPTLEASIGTAPSFAGARRRGSPSTSSPRSQRTPGAEPSAGRRPGPARRPRGSPRSRGTSRSRARR
jgi:CDGSH-type Zn-finger protein